MSWGREQRGEQGHFQLARETTWAEEPQFNAAFCPPLVSITAGGFWQGEREREGRKRDPMANSVCRGRSVTPCSSFISRLDYREERDSHFKRQFDLRSTQEHNLKEDLRMQLKREYKGHTVTDAGQGNLAIPESVRRRNLC